MFSFVVAAMLSSVPGFAASPTRDPLDALKRLYTRPAANADQPRQNPIWRLGERLFFDPRLSASNTLSCAGCHQPQSAWADHRAKAQGEDREPLTLKAPTLLNVASLDRYGWIGRFPDVETVSFFAITSPKNMNLKIEDLLVRLKSDPVYVQAFAAVFSDHAISKHNVGEAIANFVGSIHSGIAPFDRWIAGDEAAIDAQAKRGFVLFNEKARCARCHSGWTFTDGSFHDIGTVSGDDPGRGVLFSKSIKLQHAFKTPTLRDVANRAPYTHDGAIATLADMIDLYDKGGIERPSRSDAIAPLRLSATEKADLLAFLGTLSGPATFTASER